MEKCAIVDYSEKLRANFHFLIVDQSVKLKKKSQKCVI